MGPFHIPWSTFAAVLVILFSALVAIAWALWDKSRDGKGGGE